MSRDEDYDSFAEYLADDLNFNAVEGLKWWIKGIGKMLVYAWVIPVLFIIGEFTGSFVLFYGVILVYLVWFYLVLSYAVYREKHTDEKVWYAIGE